MMSPSLPSSPESSERPSTPEPIRLVAYSSSPAGDLEEQDSDLEEDRGRPASPASSVGSGGYLCRSRSSSPAFVEESGDEEPSDEAPRNRRRRNYTRISIASRLRQLREAVEY